MCSCRCTVAVCWYLVLVDMVDEWTPFGREAIKRDLETDAGVASIC